ncbi:MAG: hypothetical protein QM817_00590 [Archangium sp.]
MKLWLPVIVSAAIMLTLFGVVFSMQWHDDHSLETLTPHGERLFAIACFAVPCLPALGALWAAISRRIVTRLTVVLVLLFVAGLAVPVVFLMVLPPMFGGHYTRSFTSPDGEREAHLFVNSFLGCRATVYVSEPRAIWGVAGETRDLKCESESVIWLPDGGVGVDGGAPEPVFFNFGPH